MPRVLRLQADTDLWAGSFDGQDQELHHLLHLKRCRKGLAVMAKHSEACLDDGAHPRLPHILAMPFSLQFEHASPGMRPF